MKKVLFILAVIASLVFSASLIAQEPQTKIVFVDSRAAIQAHPAGVQSKDLEAKARAEIEGLQVELQAIVDKANSGAELTADEKSRYEIVAKSIRDVQTRTAQDIASTAKPALDAVDAAIKALAQENNYGIVLDREVAGLAGTGLVVYAREDLDITPLVIARVQGQ
jgi:outer membrane protein